MNALRRILSEVPIAVLDGGLATELERRGLNIDNELWSAGALITHPELLLNIHLDYLTAGANIITTSSYQATYQGFERNGIPHEAATNLIGLSVQIARDAVKQFSAKSSHHQPVIIAASVGSYGAFLADGSEYRGHYSIGFQELKEFHRERLKTLVSSQPDMLACEAFPCLVEAKAVLDELKAYPTVSAWISFTCADTKHISNGELISECAKFLDTQPQVAAVGVNCVPPQNVQALIEEIKSGTDKPIIVYPNSGEVFNTDTKTWEGSKISLAEYAPKWIEAGATIIGGCCRTTPEMIRTLARSLHK